MGIVYLAEQTEPVRRRVALKVIKRGMDTDQVIARFEAERQALALMDHAHVAKVFDAGVTEDGLPYFVMEHVAGVPITEHCDRHRLNIDDRLNLFIQVCEAVQHAHQKGIIHRDLKPTNILVSVRDEKARVKVIDFGVAKATNQRLTERTVFTDQGQLIGTPEYMSPEQAEMTAQDIDTRSDIYSLGVLLYELLTGALPFDKETLREAGLAGIQRLIREVEPARPSTKLSSLASSVKDARTATHIAESRRTELRALTGVLRHDLDWVVMKCLEKDRERRYETANAIAMELRRFMNDEPVLAGPPTRRYRVIKFVRRHRAGVATSVTIVAVFILATAMVMSYGVSENRQRRIAETTTEISREVIAFLNEDLIGAAAPTSMGGQGIDVTMRTLLDVAATRIDSASKDRFGNKPLVEAAIRETIGNTYVKLGAPDLSVRHLERARLLYEESKGVEDPASLIAAQNLGYAYHKLGRFDDAETVLSDTIERMSRVFGRDDAVTLGAQGNLALVFGGRRRFDEAERLSVELIRLSTNRYGGDAPETQLLLNNVANFYQELNRHTDAGRLYEELYNLDPDNAMYVSNLGGHYVETGRLNEARRLLEQALELQRIELGEDHLDTITTKESLAIVFKRLEQFADAERLYTNVLDVREQTLSEDYPATWRARNNLALLYQELSPPDETPDEEHARLTKARDLLEQVLEYRQRTLGPGHRDTLQSMARLAGVLTELGEYDRAELIHRAAVDQHRTYLGMADRATLFAIMNFAKWYSDQDNFEKAAELQTEAIAAAADVWPEGSDYLGAFRGEYGHTLFGQQQFVEAERVLNEAYEELKRHPGPVASNYAPGVADYLVKLYDAWHEAEPEGGYDLKAVEWHRNRDDLNGADSAGSG